MTPTTPPAPVVPSKSPVVGVVTGLLSNLAGTANDNGGGSTRRMIMATGGVALLALGPKYGLNIDPQTATWGIITIVAGFLGFGNMKEAIQAHADANAKAADMIPDVAAAIVELKKGPEDKS